jgi:uncharacterized membrane protein YdjX (TVP38/TMEM64 family)
VSMLALILLACVVPVGALVNALQGWLDGLGLAGRFAFPAIYVLATLLFVPGSLLTAAAGALFGLSWGTAVVSVASTLAAALAFLIARHLARQTVARRAEANPRFRAIDRAIEQGGWRIIALLRLSPAVPFSLANYAFGLTGIPFWPYLAASWLAMLPGTFLYVYLGNLGREGLAAAGGTSAYGPWQWALLIAGLLATVVVIVHVTRLARRALRESTDIEASAQPRSPESSKVRAWSVLATAGIALAVLATAVYAGAHREDLRRWAESHSSAQDPLEAR